MAAASYLPRRHAAPWFIIEGVLLVLLGALAAALPELAGVAGALVFGWVLVLAGVFRFASVLGARRHAHLALSLLSSLAALVAGALIVWRPVIGAVTLAIFVGAYLFVHGLAVIGLGWDQRRRAGRGWPWLMISGAVDVLLALLILAMGARANVLLLGFIVAIDLIFAGVARITLGLHARRVV
jgi:uncharacterized membrane protein HdeD (DUF308 family)